MIATLQQHIIIVLKMELKLFNKDMKNAAYDTTDFLSFSKPEKVREIYPRYKDFYSSQQICPRTDAILQKSKWYSEQ